MLSINQILEALQRNLAALHDTKGNSANEYRFVA